MTETSDAAQKRRGRPPGRRPLSEGSADDTRHAIRRHALRLFNRRGYAAVSIEDIAGAAGLTRATLYYHYKSKADIFLESVLATMADAATEIEQVVEQKDLSVLDSISLYLEQRRAETEALAAREESQLGDEHVSEAMIEEAMPHLDARQQSRAREAINGLHHHTRRLMAEGVARGEMRDLPPELLDYMFWQLFEPGVYPLAPGTSRRDFEQSLLDAFFGGVRRRA